MAQQRTFEKLCRDFRVTPDEREALAWQLGQIRARATYRALTPTQGDDHGPA